MRILARGLLIVLLLGGSAHADDPAPTVAVPSGIPVRLDGWPSPSEWSESVTLDLGAGASLRMQQVRGTLLLALATDRAWPKNARLLVHLAPGEAKTGVNTAGTLRIDYEPREHDRPHVIAHTMTDLSLARLPDRIVGRFMELKQRAHLEIAIPGDLLPEAPHHRLLVQWTIPGNAGLGLWPRTVNMRAPGRGMPPGLASGANWGRLTGLDGRGPGAYPASQWKDWIQTDNELEAHSDAAHSYARLLVEEWRNQPKDDVIAENEFFSHMRAIEAHERLTAKDLLAKATVLHWINRREEAQGLYDALAAGDPAIAKSSASARARLAESRHRFGLAEGIWTSIAKRPGLPPMSVKQYEALAAHAKRYGDLWNSEQFRRQHAALVEDQPLVAMTTPRGTSVLVLHRDRAPKAVDHFLSFVEDGSYVGTLFHKVHGDALAEGGSPLSKTHGCDFSGADRSKVEVRSIAGVANGEHTFFQGAVALLAHPDGTLKSDFFVVTGAHADWSKERHVIIGHVLSGQDAIDRISRCDAIKAIRILGR